MITWIVAAWFLGTATVVAAEPTQTEAQASTITVKTSRASKMLVQAWADEYMKQHEDLKIVVTSKQSDNADLEYVNNKVEGKAVTYVGRYAILPVTSSANPLLSELQSKGWSKNDLKKLYFSSLDEELDEEDEANSGKAGKLRERLTVYSGANASSASIVFADHFGFHTSELRGNKILGDDLYLLNAISEDKQSLTFNNVAYLYDIQSRQLKNDLAILPLKVKGEVSDALQQGNLDVALQALEQQQTDVIPVETFGFTYHRLNPKAELFLEWVVSNGQQFNHQQGFLRLTESEIQAQLKTLAQR